MSNSKRFFRFGPMGLAWICLCGNIAFAQSPKIIKIVAQGEPTPRGGAFGPFILDAFSFNDKEDYAFSNQIVGGTARRMIFVTSGGATSAIVAVGDSIPGIGKFQNLGGISLNNGGAVAFGAQAILDGSTRQVVFLAGAQGISKIVLDGDPVSGGTIGSPFLRLNSLNNAGAVALQAFINPSPPFRQAIFLHNAGAISKVVITGEPTPIGGNFRFGFLNLMDFNDVGTVLFYDKIENGSSQEGLFVANGSVISKIVAEGDLAPDGNKFSFFGNFASINNLGDVVFVATVCTNTCYDGLFLFSNGVISLIAKQGQSAPGGGQFDSFTTPSINDAKQIAFQTRGTLFGNFIASNGVIEKIVTRGDPTPFGGSFSDFGSFPQINAGGAVAFAASVNGGSAASGLFLWNGGPRIAVSRDRVEFDNVPPGETARVDFEVSSAGGKPLTVQEITVTPGPPFGLENVPSLPLTLEPGQKTQFFVTYSPSSGGNAANFLGTAAALQEGSLAIKTDARNSPTTVVPLIAPKSIILKVDIVPSAGTEIKAGQSATIEIKVVDQSNQVITDFDGGATIRLLVDQSTPGITRLPVSQSVSISRGIGQPVFFFTPQEPFSADKPIDPNTVLSGKAVIEVQLENSNVAPVTKEIPVKSPLDFFIDRIEIQQGIKDSDKDVFLEYQPGVHRTFPALPFIAEHNTAVRVFVGYTNTVPIAFSKVERRTDISARLKISLNGQVIKTIEEMKSGGSATRTFVLKDSYSTQEQAQLQDALFAFFDHTELKDPGTYTFQAELRFDSILDEIAGEKSNNQKSAPAAFVATNPIRVLAAVGARVGEIQPKVEAEIWDFLRNVFPIQDSKLEANDPNTRVHYFSGGFIFSDIKLGTLTGILDRYNKEHPGNQREFLLMFSRGELAKEMCTSPHVGGCAESIGGRVGIIDFLDAAGAAHELAHLLGLRDTYKTDKYKTSDGEPNPRRSNATNGGNFVEDGNIDFIVRDQALPESQFQEFMGTRRWVDRVTWNHLYQKKFRLGAQVEMPLASASGFIAVSGLIDTNDTAILNPFLTLPQVPRVSVPQAGEYSFEFKNSAGTSLNAFAFNVEFIMPEIGKVSQAPFSFNLPLPEGTAKMVLKKNGIEMASRMISANSPAIQLISPTSGETIRGVKTIQWAASDLDGDKLTYDILYSADGQNQLVLAVNLDTASYQWDSRLSPPSASASFTVIANDGINEGRAVADHLVVDNPTGVDNQDETLPSEYALKQNHPNPFNPETRIQFDLSKPSHLRIEIYNVHGQKIRTLLDEHRPVGSYTVLWDGRMDSGELAASGIYFCRLVVGDFRQTRKMTLLR